MRRVLCRPAAYPQLKLSPVRRSWVQVTLVETGQDFQRSAIEDWFARCAAVLHCSLPNHQGSAAQHLATLALHRQVVHCLPVAQGPGHLPANQGAADEQQVGAQQRAQAARAGLAESQAHGAAAASRQTSADRDTAATR